MGPRLASRGNVPVSAQASHAAGLQWGRGSRAAETAKLCGAADGTPAFNGAAVREPRKLLSTVPDIKAVCLQWGRGSRAAETLALARDRHQRADPFNGAAVREPRKLGHPPAAADAVHLQWGRGSRAAET